MKLSALFFSTAILLAVLNEAKAATYSMEPVADARVIHLQNYDAQNYASDTLSVYTDTSGGNTQRTFIKFDLSQITLTTNEHVDSATLTLISFTSFGNNPGKPMEVYRVLSPWTETGLTWLNRDATHAWTNAGGDFAGTGGQPYAVSTNSGGSGQPVTWNVTALVQEWVTNAGNNYGLMLKSADGNRLTFGQRELAATASRPLLTVVVTQPRLYANSSGGQFMLWWSGSGVLQEKTNLNPAMAWSDSGRTVTPSGGTNFVTIPGPKGNNFFRLRVGP